MPTTSSTATAPGGAHPHRGAESLQRARSSSAFVVTPVSLASISCVWPSRACSRALSAEEPRSEPCWVLQRCRCQVE